jgi:DNA-binding transcriptional MerR regulator
MSKSADAFRTISEVAEWLDTPAHVLRFWESKFTQVKPVKRAGGRRYYRPADMRLLGGIKKLLHDDGMTIKGVQKVLREQGIRHVSSLCELSLGDEDESDIILLEDVPASEPLDTVVPFAKPEMAELPEMAGEIAVPEVDPEIEDEDLPIVGDVETAPALDVPFSEQDLVVTDTVAAAESPEIVEDLSAELVEPRERTPLAEQTQTEAALPSFLQRSMEDRRADDAQTDPEPVVAPPPPPAEPTPSALTYLARIRHLSPEQAQQIAPILDQLRAVAR